MTRRRLTELTAAHRAAIPDHVARWIAIGHATDEADWDTFERAAQDCYGYAQLPWHANVIRVPSPLVLALAAPTAAYLLDSVAVRGAVHGAVGGAVGEAVGEAVREAVRGAVHGAVGEAVGGAVRGAVDVAVHVAVGEAVHGAVDGAVRGAVDGAVGGAVHVAVRGAVHGAVDVAVGEAVRGAVHGAVGGAVGGAVHEAVGGNWWRYIGGQWWASWLAYTSFYRDVCGLELGGDLWDRDRAYAQAQSAAGWWWPHRRFCADDQTEILTQNGWRTHDRLFEGDLVMTLNHETGLSEWQPVGGVYRFDVENEPMLSIEGNAISSLTTMDHRWPTMHRSRRPFGLARSWTTSEQLNSNDSIITGARCADVPTDAKWADALVELVAWFYTEGSLTTENGGMKIAQSAIVNPDLVARIQSALTVLYGPASERDMRHGHRTAVPCEFDDCEWPATNHILCNAHNEQRRRHGVTRVVVRKTMPPARAGQEPRWRQATDTDGMTTFSLNRAAAEPILDAAPGKNVRLGFIRELTAGQLDLFIRTSIAADGHKPAAVVSTGGSIAQRRGEWLDAFELACVLSGRTPHTTIVNATYKGGPYSMRRVHAREYSATWDFKASRTSTVRYTGTVWCPGTPNKTWLARRNGTVWFTGNTMVADRPRVLHLEQAGPSGWGSHRLHCETGPAIAWSDGWALHFWHGIHVPADLVEGDGWAPDRILRERNAEIRRCAIERRGWDRFVVDADLAQVGRAEPDPGNPGRELRLYDVPAAIYDEPVRVLIADNGSPDRDGSRRTFGLTVPADVPDPTSAAAWTYGCGRSEYAALARRT